MKLIVGLGNPGPEYESTRHNIGFMVVDKLARELSNNPAWEENKTCKSLVAKAGGVVLVKPLIFMNNSGIAVQCLVDFYKIHPSDVWIIHDDIDLPIGKIRIRVKGGSAGHNGVTSVMNHLKSDSVVRFRLGIGRGKEPDGISPDKNLHHRSVIAFVLSRFGRGEAGAMKHLIKHGVEAIRIALLEGIDKAMNRFN